VTSGNGRDDGDTIPLFDRSFQVLQKTDIVTVDVNVYEPANLSGFIADAFLDTGKIFF
jgi:hypothetical protein